MSETKNAARREQMNIPDWGTIIVVVILLFFGLMMLYSASSYNAQIKYGDGLHFVKSQSIAIGLGAVLLIVLTIIPTKIWKTKLSLVTYILSLGTIFLVLTPLAIKSGGAKRWVSLGSFSFQPAELVKVGVILVMAMLISKYKDALGKLTPYIFMLAFPIVPAALVGLLTSDLGSAIIIFAIGIIMLLVVVPKTRYIWITLLVAIAGAAILVVTSEYRMQRIYAWLDVEAYSGDESYQIMQALYAIASGGIFGKGLGKSTQKLGFVPESQNDMIFSIVVEELGILGGVMLLVLFAVLIWRLILLYRSCDDLFGQMLLVGVVSHIGVQAFVNTAVVTGLIPNTGVPLPFISYGGSQIIMILAEIGLCMSVARERPAKARTFVQRRMEDAVRA